LDVEKTLQNLLHKIEEDEENAEEKDEEFERRLKSILGRYHINNEAFFAEVVNLHRNL
jgi:hypothetical protein